MAAIIYEADKNFGIQISLFAKPKTIKLNVQQFLKFNRG
mgnify:CR=1 FL=1